MDPVQYPQVVTVGTQIPDEIGPDEEIQLDEQTVGLVTEYLQELATVVQPISEYEDVAGCPPCPCAP
jgi:hypothetical protein